MPRTTVDIDAPILRDLKRLTKQRKQPLGRVVSDLLGEALANLREQKPRPRSLQWTSQPMHARVDLDDKEAVWRELDERTGDADP